MEREREKNEVEGGGEKKKSEISIVRFTSMR
jgi:hypothetical protein